MLACIVWLIFERRRQGQNIPFFGNIILGSLLAMILSRLMQNFSAYRPRPIHSSSLAYDLPYGIETSTLEGWSSFQATPVHLPFQLPPEFSCLPTVGRCSPFMDNCGNRFSTCLCGPTLPKRPCRRRVNWSFLHSWRIPFNFRLIISKVKLTINEKWMPLLWTLSFLYIFQVGTMFDDVRNYGSFIKEVLGL